VADSQLLIIAKAAKTLSATVRQFQQTRETKRLRELAKAELKRHGSAGLMARGIRRWWMKIGMRKIRSNDGTVMKATYGRGRDNVASNDAAAKATYRRGRENVCFDSLVGATEENNLKLTFEKKKDKERNATNAESARYNDVTTKGSFGRGREKVTNHSDAVVKVAYGRIRENIVINNADNVAGEEKMLQPIMMMLHREHTIEKEKTLLAMMLLLQKAHMAVEEKTL